MSILSLRLPDSLHLRLRKIAAEEGISINQLVTLAAAEKVASILTVDYLEARARRADLATFDRILDRVPPGAPEPGDEQPPPSERSKRPTRGLELREPSGRYRAKKKTSRSRPKTAR